MEPYPFLPLLPQLQFLCTPAEYTEILGPLIRKWGAFPKDQDRYGRIVPAYLYARCPLCHFEYREPADTYSLRVWGGANYMCSALCNSAKAQHAEFQRC